MGESVTDNLIFKKFAWYKSYQFEFTNQTFKNKLIDKALFQTFGMVLQKNIYIMEPRNLYDIGKMQNKFPDYDKFSVYLWFLHFILVGMV